jgi:LysM repeat protein
MDPTHPDFFRRADPFVGRRSGLRMLRWLLPLAAAVPLLIAVMQSRPVAKPVRVVEEAEPAAPAALALPPLEAERFSVVQEEEPPAPVRERVLKPRSHVVAYGETLSGIAQDYRCALEDLASANGLDPGGTLLAGTILLLPRPGAVAAVEPAPESQGAGVVLTPVPPNWRPPAPPVASVQVAASPAPVLRPAPAPLREVSPPRSVVIAPSAVVAEAAAAAEESIPGVVQPVSGRTLSSDSEVSIHYLVQPSDRLESIAAAHFTTVSALKRLNGVGSITAGQVIRIPVDQCLSQSR